MTNRTNIYDIFPCYDALPKEEIGNRGKTNFGPGVKGPFNECTYIDPKTGGEKWVRFYIVYGRRVEVPFPQPSENDIEAFRTRIELLLESLELIEDIDMLRIPQNERRIVENAILSTENPHLIDSCKKLLGQILLINRDKWGEFYKLFDIYKYSEPEINNLIYTMQQYVIDSTNSDK